MSNYVSVTLMHFIFIYLHLRKVFVSRHKYKKGSLYSFIYTYDKTLSPDINIREAYLFRTYALPVHKFWKTRGLPASWEVGITKNSLRKEAGNKLKKREICYVYFALSKICIDYAYKTSKK